jgi:hypothetical protein
LFVERWSASLGLYLDVRLTPGLRRGADGLPERGSSRYQENKMRIELKLEHYRTIRDFMEEIELSPEDAMSPAEEEALALVKQVINNIEKRRAQPAHAGGVKHKYRRRWPVVVKV